jgi:hypothetical protein
LILLHHRLDQPVSSKGALDGRAGTRTERIIRAAAFAPTTPEHSAEELWTRRRHGHDFDVGVGQRGAVSDHRTPP